MLPNASSRPPQRVPNRHTRAYKDMLKSTDAITKRLGASPQQPKPAAEPAPPKEA